MPFHVITSMFQRMWPMLPLGVLIYLAGCQPGTPPQSQGSSEKLPTSRGKEGLNEQGILTVAVTNYPLEYLARRIGGDRVQIEFPMAGTGDPAEWNVTKEGVQVLQKAELIVANGADYEKWLSQVTIPDERMVPTAAGFRDEWIQVQDAVTHSHGPEGAHSHSGTAFTTWIDFDLASRQAAALAAAFSAARPQWQAEFTARLQEVDQDLGKLDQAMQDAARIWGDQPLVVSHPVYHYWARRYHLNTRAVHWEPDSVPDEDAQKELRALLQEHPARVMIWEREPQAEVAQVVRDAGLQIVVFDPCGNRPTSGDWLEVMQKNVASFPRGAESESKQ